MIQVYIPIPIYKGKPRLTCHKFEVNMENYLITFIREYTAQAQK
jgi:hypothetical protein